MQRVGVIAGRCDGLVTESVAFFPPSRGTRLQVRVRRANGLCAWQGADHFVESCLGDVDCLLHLGNLPLVFGQAHFGGGLARRASA